MDSEYMSSGCESGWTMYLEDHFINPSSSSSSSSLRNPPVVDQEGNISNYQWCRSKHHDDDDMAGGQQPEEEDNLSMLSDASSPNLHHLQGYFTPKTECNSTQPHHHHQIYNAYDSHFLDDTASSHLMDLYPNNGYIPTNNTAPPVETFLQYPSHGFFQRDIEGSSALQHQLGFGIMQPPNSIIPTNAHSPVQYSEQWSGWRRDTEFR